MTDIRFSNGGQSPDIAGAKKISKPVDNDLKVGGANIEVDDKAKINEPRGAVGLSGPLESTPNDDGKKRATVALS